MKRKIKRIIKNATATNAKTIAKSENKFLNISLLETRYKRKDTKEISTNKIKFFKTKLIFFLLDRNNFLGLDFFLAVFFTLFFLAIVCSLMYTIKYTI